MCNNMQNEFIKFLFICNQQTDLVVFSLSRYLCDAVNFACILISLFVEFDSKSKQNNNLEIENYDILDESHTII